MKPQSSADLHIVSSSPHAHSGASVSRIMADVLIALVPAFAAACWFFGWDAIRLTAACVTACLASEWLCRKAMRRDNTLSDLSAVVTGVLLAFNLPPALPTWMAVAGSVVAIAIAKQTFGGLGYNPFNPALIGRAFLLISCTGPMTTWSASAWRGADALTTATPLGLVKEALKAGQPLPFTLTQDMTWNFFIGNMNGCIGEVSAAAILLGVAYLLFRRVITWHVPVAYLGTAVLYAVILRFTSANAMPVSFHLFTGGLMLGACFMATDMVTTPITRSGLLLFGVGCGLLTMVFRTVVNGAYPEGVSFAILIMNAFTPLINRATKRQPFGAKSP
ncbi:MAG: RnfABCDGE type electron transport complex subunit D [Lentisphaerae bacterium]|nr:RnfABCDGE type electron transport complex subunit D [Lentisphaerota bacterium]